MKNDVLLNLNENPKSLNYKKKLYSHCFYYLSVSHKCLSKKNIKIYII